MAAGAVAVPTIIPLRAPYPGQHKAAVDTSTKIELHSETEGVKIYYTVNGSKPEPFQTIGPAARATRIYREPFTLAAGKRTIKAVAVTEDGRESFVVTKVFEVEQLESDIVVHNGDDLEFMSEIPIVQQAKRDVQKFVDKMVTGREAWAEVQRMKQSGVSATGLNVNGVDGSSSFARNGASTVDAQLRNLHLTNGELGLKKRSWTATDRFEQAADKYQSSYLKCPSCSAPRPFDLNAKFCANCGLTLPSFQQPAVSPLGNDELGPCWNCKAVVPYSLAKCIVCDVSLVKRTVTPPPRPAVVVADCLLCTICGTANLPNRAANCITCGANLRTCGKLLRKDPDNPACTQLVTLKCAQCGCMNNSDVANCIQCHGKSLLATVVCSTCNATNSADSQFCGTCGLALIAPPAGMLRNGMTVLQNAVIPPMMISNQLNGHALPVQPAATRLDPPKRDAITQTVGLLYPSNVDVTSKNRENDSKTSSADKDSNERKPLLTAVSAGRGTICVSLTEPQTLLAKANGTHLRSSEGSHGNHTILQICSFGTSPGKVLEASIEDDGDEFTIVVTFKRHDDGDAVRRRNRVNSDSDDNESVGELRGVSRELLRTYGSGRRSNCSSRDGFDSDRSANSTARSKKAHRKMPPKSPKKAVKKSEAADAVKVKEEDRKLLKEVAKNGGGEPTEIRQLIEEGANPNCVNKDGVPVLHIAVINKHVEAVRALVEDGADVNAKGPQRGNTALHEAVALGYTGVKVVDVLLNCGADVNVKNDKGDSPYEMAIKDGQDVIVKKLASFLGQSKLDKLTKPRPARGANDF